MYGPYYLSYFPQHYDRDENYTIVKSIPPIGKRSTIFYHEFANAVYLTLDSGYLHDYYDWQETLVQ